MGIRAVFGKLARAFLSRSWVHAVPTALACHDGRYTDYPALAEVKATG
jgi:hypothetical protein